MKILLRETSEGQVIALSPDTGEKLSRIEKPAVWSDESEFRSDCEHPEGIIWDSWENARENLKNHRIVID